MAATITINQTGVPVTTSLAAVGNVIPTPARFVTLQIQNTGANALTHFAIYRQFANGLIVPWLADTDFATATSKCSASGGTSGNPPNTLPAGQTAWIDLDVGITTGIQVYAQAGTATTINLFGAALNTSGG